jgi:ATP-dependent DNA helicase PIF1
MNENQLKALSAVKEHKSIFLTGSAGTGKSFTLKAIVSYLNNNYSDDEFAITALTGCASVLIKGQTIHSFLYLGISRDINQIYDNLQKYKFKFNKLKKLKVLIIDEISMMDNQLFELIHNLLMKIKNCFDKPFGGVQMILVGDFYQLPPIENNYCFTSHIWNLLNPIPIILTSIIRQKDDLVLQEILEEIRNDKPSEKTINILKSLIISPNQSFKDNEIKPTRLFPININVDKINNYEFKKLLKINNFQKNTYNAILIIKNKNEPKIDISDYNLTLTLNCQIMVIRNISIDDKLVNGTRGIVIELNPSNVIIKDLDGKLHTISYYTDDTKGKNQISFMPLKLAYAISIHKSQGSSIDCLEIDLGNDVFTTGQLYTALSRATNIKNLRLSNFSINSFIINENVKNFYQNLK